MSEGACDNTPTAATCRLGVFYHVVQAGDPASYTFTWPASVRYSADLLRYSGVNTAVPFDASAVQVGPPDTSPINAPTATTSRRQCRMVVRLAAVDTNGISRRRPPRQSPQRRTPGGGHRCTLAVSDLRPGRPRARAGTAAFTVSGSAQTLAGSDRGFQPAAAVTPTRATGRCAWTRGHDGCQAGARRHRRFRHSRPRRELRGIGLCRGRNGAQRLLRRGHRHGGDPAASAPASQHGVRHPLSVRDLWCCASRERLRLRVNSAPAPAQCVTYTSRTGRSSQTIPAASLSPNNAWSADRGDPEPR